MCWSFLPRAETAKNQTVHTLLLLRRSANIFPFVENKGIGPNTVLSWTSDADLILFSEVLCIGEYEWVKDECN